MMLCVCSSYLASLLAIGLVQKKSRRGLRIWHFQGCQRNSTWNFQGLIKKEVEFPIKKVGICILNNPPNPVCLCLDFFWHGPIWLIGNN